MSDMLNLIPVALSLLVFGIDPTIFMLTSRPTSISPTMHTSFPIDTDVEICGGSTFVSDFSEIEKSLPVVVEQISSLEELNTWLKSKECIQSVKLADFLIKTNPPQREFIVEFKSNDGSSITKVIDIFVLGNGRFSFSKLRDL